MKNFTKYLYNPYPQTLNRWSITIAISLFISLFMVIFQPFGLQNFKSDHKTIFLCGYGLVTFVILIINLMVLPVLFPRLLGEDRWTVGKHLLMLCWIVVTISAGNYVYSYLIHAVNWVGLMGFLIFIVFTLLVSVIPVTGLTLITYNRMLIKNLAISGELNNMISGQSRTGPSEDHLLSFTAENKKQTVACRLQELICIESKGNYVTISFLAEGKPSRILLRNTLKNIEI